MVAAQSTELADLTDPTSLHDPDISKKQLDAETLAEVDIGRLYRLIGNPDLTLAQLDQIKTAATKIGHIGLLDQIYATINERAARENGATPKQVSEIQRALLRRVRNQDVEDSLRRSGYTGTIADVLKEPEEQQEAPKSFANHSKIPKEILAMFGVKPNEPTAEELYRDIGITPQQPTPLELLNTLKAANEQKRRTSAFETHYRLEKASETRFNLSLPEEQIDALKEAIMTVAKPYGIDEIYRILTLRKIKEKLAAEKDRPSLLDRLDLPDEVRKIVENNGDVTVLCKYYGITPLTPTREELLTALKISIREEDTTIHNESTPTGDLYQRIFGRDFDELEFKFPTPGNPDTKIPLVYGDLSTMTELPEPIARLFRNSNPESLRDKLNNVILFKKGLLPNAPRV